MSVFRSIVFSAVVVGALVGAAVTAAQQRPGDAHRTARGEIGSRSLFQPARKIAVALLYRYPRLVIAGAGLQHEEGGGPDALELFVLQVIELYENNGGGMMRPEDEVVLTARCGFQKVGLRWTPSFGQKIGRP